MSQFRLLPARQEFILAQRTKPSETVQPISLANSNGILDNMELSTRKLKYQPKKIRREKERERKKEN